MSPDLRYPALSDLKATCKRRVPWFVWEYLDSATGRESVKPRNRAELDKVLFRPAILRGAIVPDLSTRFLGQDYAMPVGVAPIGMSGLIWPGAEAALAGMAQGTRLPYCLSTVATRLPEEIGPIAGDMGWFQLYPPKDPAIRADILTRAHKAGFRVLVLTVDLPGPSRRERQLRAQLAIPPKLTPAMLWQIAQRPAWALGTLRHGQPRLRLMEDYLKLDGNAPSTAHPGYLLRAAPDWDYLHAVRALWEGPLVVKGVLDPQDADPLRAAGVDAIWVSNHGGRQFDGAPPALDALRQIRATLGPEMPLIYDGGIETGLDVLRALAFGANFTMMGRGWHYALGALGAQGGSHLAQILRDDMASNMMQMGITRPEQAATQGWAPSPAPES
ncbi:alpha-hydroxy acid oxidase [Roseinatronobacter bogoriensis]|uniref:Alpha-hydroxy-acid oxidizing protein n=1 Tax=Roseinatronobacter bogoriensis subsp. barguzinensis TaxID=441209 RepID=A0A2K8KBE8_9RHOB|nr:MULTISPECIES: alpha-hydroxy acid oxidase [Rhodobaca]ATX66769.1 alpha-hydroxy-acid oxidizing protein [Rhodobaca barguzinensis]MBB4206231.1 L-lactate dehydrogenase (cytochrome) [Rhodobaca bogoriensis DSM 18756]TDW40976.1 L-lactate dehydrogenase (cytochrome) [Rhodobaca barguzinensis]TDY74846.1 L-lactate dehydrogenase (cytochrome) [Rhodobaca bogoriensis DSM 18756]